MMFELKTRLLSMAARLMLERRLGDALLLLHHVAEALKGGNKVSNVALVVYRRLPKAWKHPEGPATEQEFVTAIEAGRRFFLAVQALALR